MRSFIIEYGANGVSLIGPFFLPRYDHYTRSFSIVWRNRPNVQIIEIEDPEIQNPDDAGHGENSRPWSAYSGVAVFLPRCHHQADLVFFDAQEVDDEGNPFSFVITDEDIHSCGDVDHPVSLIPFGWQGGSSGGGGGEGGGRGRGDGGAGRGRGDGGGGRGGAGDGRGGGRGRGDGGAGHGRGGGGGGGGGGRGQGDGGAGPGHRDGGVGRGRGDDERGRARGGSNDGGGGLGGGYGIASH